MVLDSFSKTVLKLSLVQVYDALGNQNLHYEEQSLKPTTMNF